jgi:Na+-driven multidrug efflux pump
MGVWLGSTCDWIVRAIALVVVFFQGRWHKVTV